MFPGFLQGMEVCFRERAGAVGRRGTIDDIDDTDDVDDGGGRATGYGPAR